MAGIDDEARILRAKYLDWCSAQVADRFLALTADEIYELAEQATHGRPELVGPLASLSSNIPEMSDQPDWRSAFDPAMATTSEAEPFRALVAKVTEVLAEQIGLPTFEEWSAAYQESPDDFDPDLLGFWREES